MTKIERRVKLEHQLAEAVEGASHFGGTHTDRVLIDFLIDKIAELQMEIEELKSSKESYILKPDGCE